MTAVTVRAPAKLNLQLAVGPLREDGYHDLVTVFHAVSLTDEVTVAPAGDGPSRDGRGVVGRVTVVGEGADSVPTGGDNLVVKAAAALAKAVTGKATHAKAASAKVTAPVAAVDISVRKRIPVAAGLAGGSADAAATLVACNELWRTSFGQRELVEVAAGVGSDVAFALLGGTAVGQGRGERLTPALTAGEYHWVLAFADGQLATPRVYAALDRQREAADRPADPRPGIDTELMAALRSGRPAAVGDALGNELQSAALSLFPALRKTLAAGVELGALGAVVAGSGPTCAFLTADADRALDLAVALSGAGVCRAVATASGPVPGAAVSDASAVPAGAR